MSNEIAKLFVTVGANIDDFKKGMGDISAITKKVGAGMSVAGAAILAEVGVATKMAADEEANVARLSAALNTIGVSYEAVQGKLEGYINAQQVSTGFADDQQREALSALIPIVGDYDKSIELMGLTMDLARWKNMDLSAAAEIVGKVAGGNTGILSRYGIILEKGATSTEALAQMQKLAAGQAEAYGKTAKGQMEALTNGLGDMQEAIGSALLPILKEIIDAVLPIVEGFKTWASENPELLKTIVVVVAALSGLMAVLGPILMILPGIVAVLPLLGAALTVATGPVGLIIAAIAALIAIGILLYQNWDTVSAKAKEIWGGIVSFFKGVWSALVWGFENYINIYIDGLNSVIGLLNSIPGVSLGTIGRANLGGSLPSFAGYEGIIPGVPGTPIPAIVHAGEYIGQGGGNQTIQLFIDGEQVSNVVEKRLYDRIRYQEIPSYL